MVDVMTYKVIVTREGDHWLAKVPQVEGTQTFARSLPKLDVEVREAIALGLDLPEGAETTLELDYEIHTGDDTRDQRFTEVRMGRLKVKAAKDALDQRTAALAREVSTDLSVRDAGWLLGVSPQRVSQLSSSTNVRLAKNAEIERAVDEIKKHYGAALQRLGE